MKSTIELMSRGDMEFCAEQARREGWNPGLHDMDVFYETDPSGWFKAVDDQGRIIGSISAVAYDAQFGFVGFFVVRPEWRGGRVGLELGGAAFEHLGGRVIGQDGVFAKVANYETWGFELAYRNLRYEWRDGSLPPDNGLSTQAYHPGLLSGILAFDEGLFPCRRDSFLKRWLAMPEAVIRTSVRDGNLTGWGLRRRCVSGWKIGPLLAGDAVTAAALLRDLLAGAEPQVPVYLDVPEVNEDAVRLAESFGMKPCFGTARMYKNGMPDLDVARLFGVTSFELG